MRVMHEVRKREETYEIFKQITSDIEGLPPSLRLANRERHLLWYGPLLVNRMDEKNEHPARHTDSERSTTPRIVIGDETDPRPGGRSRQQRAGLLEEPTQVQVYVLTDLVLFAVPMKKSRRRETKPWRLLDDIGVVKLLGMRETPSDTGMPRTIAVTHRILMSN